MGFFWGDLHGKLHVVKAVVVRVGEEDGQGEGFCLVHQDTHAAPETVWGVVEGAAFRGSRWDDGAGGHGVVATEAVGPGGAQGHIPRAVGELDLHAPKGHPSSSCNGICREGGEVAVQEINSARHRPREVNYKGMSLSKITTTVGLNIGTIDVGKTRLMFWDLGGQEELQSLWDKYYAESHGVIYVIDSTDEERLSESKRAFEKMITSEALEGVPILVLANKQDVETCLSIPDIKTAFSDCINKIGKRDCLTQACSALTGKGVNEGIEWMVKCVVRNIHRPPRKKDIT